MDRLHRHRGVLILLAVYLGVAITYSVSVPLGEAPDEAEHMAYIQFIADHKRLPANLAERQMVGYKAVWPPLYHILTSAIVSQVDTSSPAPLKKIDFSTPHRLLVYDGLPELNAIHTQDEAFPYQGLFLAWHLARLFSVLLGAGVVICTYLIALEIFPTNRAFALGAAALVAFIPRFTFTISVLNDDNLVNLFAALILLTTTRMGKGKHGVGAYILSGILLGLGLTTKYSTLSVALGLVTAIIVFSKRLKPEGTSVLIGLLALAGSAVAVSGWWFGYILWRFNRVDELGWFAGLLTPLTAGGIEAGSRRVMSLVTRGAIPMLEGETAAPWSLGEFALWGNTLFSSFWAGFTHLDAKGWYYWLPLMLCMVSVVGIARGWRRLREQDPVAQSQFKLLVLYFVALWPLILIRYALSRKIIETAQGRYLFPAIAAISILMLYGLLQWFRPAWRRPVTFAIAGTFFAFSLVSLPCSILAAYPPALPVYTTADAVKVDHPLNIIIDETIELVGYTIGEVTEKGALPVTLVWRSLDRATSDYVIDMRLVTKDGRTASRWLGQPANGQYPTRAWDTGDIVRDVVWLPVRGVQAGDYHLTLHIAPHLSQLLPPDQAARAGPDRRTLELIQVTLPELSHLPPAHQQEVELTPDIRLRGFDLWQAGDPAIPSPHLAYRATVPVRLVWQHPLPDDVELEVSLGGHTPLAEQGNLFLFLVGPDWQSGPQTLKIIARQAESESGQAELDGVATTSIRPRNFDVPPMATQVNANFGDEIVLLGYDFPERRGQPGAELPITLYWKALRPPTQHYIVFNHLLNYADLRQWGGKDRVPQGYYTTMLWAEGEVVRDDYTVPVDPSAPPGIYRLDLGLYADTNGQARHLPLVVDGTALDANSVTISPIKVGGPPPGITVQAPSPQHRRAEQLGEFATLLGYDASLEPEALNLTLYWRCDTRTPTDYTTFVHVLDETGQTTGQVGAIVAQMDRPPANGAYPTSLWEPGEIIPDTIQVPIPPQVAAGEYEVAIGLYDPITGSRASVTDIEGKLLPDSKVILSHITISRERQ